MYKEKGIMEEKLKTLKDFIPKGTRAKNDLFDELKAEVIMFPDFWFDILKYH